MLRTVGIDVGSATSHLCFGTVTMRRAEGLLSSKFVVVARDTSYHSPVVLTPYLSASRIDAEALRDFVHEHYTAAGLSNAEIDTGAVILTGNALLRSNSHAVADILSEHAGRLVCAAAGHDLEARLAAHGSGAAERSARGERVLNIDMGGGTTKFALAVDGEVVDTAALAIGARLLAWDEDRRVSLAHPALAAVIGQPPGPSELLSRDRELDIATQMAEQVATFAARQTARPAALLLDPQTADWRYDTIVLSGGVSEYVRGAGPTDLGDLGEALAHAVVAALAPQPLVAASTGIRATAVGTAQHSAQVSGSTIFVRTRSDLPINGRPVVRAHLQTQDTRDAGAPSAPTRNAVRSAIAAAIRRAPLGPDEQLPAVSIGWPYPPEYEHLRNLADGIADGVQLVQPAPSSQAADLVLLLDQDLAQLLGRILAEETRLACGLICIDGVTADDLDYLDVGEVIEPAGVVPILVRSLLFPDSSLPGRPTEQEFVL